MIEMVDTRPDIDVTPAEYKRLLGYPQGHELQGRALDLAEEAQSWYRANGRPWVYVRQSESLGITNGSVCIDGVPFSSQRLQQTLRQAEADAVVLVAASAGPELEQEAAKRWRAEKPDEYFFFEVFGSAVVEHLITMRGAQLCAWAEQRGLAVLPHYSPGYPDWDISQQARLLELICQTHGVSIPGDVTALESGMLRPKKSLLAVFGLTRHTDRVRRLTELNPCESCSFANCQYRRAPYAGAPLFSTNGVLKEAKQALSAMFSNGASLDHGRPYSVNVRALARWASERLVLAENPNGTIDATFRFEGKTCSNLGRPIHFEYRVHLGSADDGYPIRNQSCDPTPGDRGYESMCEYMKGAEQLIAAIRSEKPLQGQPLDCVLSWDGATSGAGCYCHASDRMHKWRLVLETLHYALAQRELQQVQDEQRASAPI
jgi:hypothetical protein